MENMLRVRVITSAHGIRGEMRVFPTADDAKCFKKLREITLDTGEEYIPTEIERVEFFKNIVILKFRGYDNINEVERYKSRDLLVTRDQAVDLEPDEYFITSLTGLTVVSDQDAKLGTPRDMLETGANGVYVAVTKDGKELMLPAIGDCILNVNLEQGRMGVYALERLMDLQCS